jgi:hypothetical protein
MNKSMTISLIHILMIFIWAIMSLLSSLIIFSLCYVYVNELIAMVSVIIYISLCFQEGIAMNDLFWEHYYEYVILV